MSSSISHNPSHASLSVYVPFIVAITVVCILSASSSLVLGHRTIGNYTQTMNLFMGFFFITFAVLKLNNIKQFAKSFANYDILAKRSKIYARLYPFIELALGAELLANYNSSSMLISRIFIGLIIVISTVGVISVGRALIEKKKLDCACMGSNFSFPLSKISLIENGLMLIMALSMLILPMSAAANMAAM